MQGLLNAPLSVWRLLPLGIRALIRAMRPRQWIKNGLIFVPFFFDGKVILSDLSPLWRIVGAFALFTCAASAIYLINDIVDVEKDRMHPKKRFRPIAAGELPIQVAWVFALLLPVIAVGGALFFSVPLALVLGVYLIKQFSYSFYFKHVVILDVMLLAAGYVLRILAGAVVISVQPSAWLYVCAGAFSLFLAVAKRRQELIKLGDKAQEIRPSYREYNMPLLDDMFRLVMTASIISYTLYTVEAQSARGGQTMLLTVPFVVYGVFRYLYLMHVKGEGGAPDEVLFKDRPLLIAIFLYFVIAGLLIYLLRPVSVVP